MTTTVILVCTVAGLVIVILWLVSRYVQLQQKLLALTKQNSYLKTEDATREEAILNEAHNRAIIIIDHATKKASEIMTRAQSVDQTADQTLAAKLAEATRLHEEELKKASSELLTLYKNALTKVQQQDIQNAAAMAKNIDAAAQKELTAFHDTLTKETVASEKLVQEKVSKEYAEVEEEIRKYKEARMQEVDNHILQIIQSVTEIVLKRQLSVADQQQLVYEALNRVKEETKV